MGKINYRAIYEENHDGWKKMTENPGKFEALLAGHYSDNNHFVYELIQNAEDTDASCVVFEYYQDKMCFYHNGRPFNEQDVIGVSSMLETTKADDAKKIGKFGMGFKSVFKYTCTPEIYSDDEAFKISNYLLPEEIDTTWDYKQEMIAGLKYEVNGEEFIPFITSNHLTKVVLPFQKREKNGSIHRIDGSDIIRKLKELEPEILLFLEHIKCLFWIDKNTAKYEKYTLQNDLGNHLCICQLKGNAATLNSKRYEDRYFFKYKKNFKVPEIGEAQVSLAFLTNSQQKSIQKIDGTDIWVFFPTKDRTSLPFMLHGSFETAVSREKLMRPSLYNQILLDAAKTLFVDTILDFKKKGLITQAFIRQILVTALGDNTIPGLKESVTDLFLKNELIPAKGDLLVNPQKAYVTVPFDLIDLEKEELFTDVFSHQKYYVTLNDEKSAGFSEYYSWLVDDLKVQVYSLDIWSSVLRQRFLSISEKADYSKILPLFSFLDEYRVDTYLKESKTVRKKSSYEERVQQSVKTAWPIIRKSRVLINAENEYVAAFNDDDKEQIFLSSTSDYHKIAKSAVILSLITDDFKSLLEDSFNIKEFDNFEYVKNKIIIKYSKYSKEVELTDDFVRNYIDDISLISRLLSSSFYMQEIQGLISERCLILARSEDNKMLLLRPSDVYKTTSLEGADLRTYYAELGKDVYFLDDEFYSEKGISLDSVHKFGIHTTPIDDGPKDNERYKALDSFRPFMTFQYLNNNIGYIQDHPNTELARKKSACILKIALDNAYKMRGKYYDNGVIKDGLCKVLEQLRKDDWLYADGDLCDIKSITLKQLDKNVYKGIELNRYTKEGKILGFCVDETDEIINSVDKLDIKAKEDLLKQLAKEFGVDISLESSGGKVFNPDELNLNEFPVKYIVNKDRLERYIENQFYAADPVRYKEVVILKRSSGDRALNRAYVKSMYTNHFGKLICQGCRKVFPEDERFVVEIANFGIDMEQLHLCLCPSCYQKYETIKKTRASEYKDSIKRAIEDYPVNNKEPYYMIQASQMPIYFTQTHLAEVQSILILLDKYGIPVKQQGINIDNGGKLSGGQMDEIVVRDGDMIEYEFLDDNKPHQITLDTDKYPSHKEFDGRPINVVFEYKGKSCRIIKKL